MERITNPPRRDWRSIVEAQGMYFHETEEQVYWDESAYYAFTAAEIDVLEKATYELDKMCLQAAEHVITNRLFEQFLMPPEFINYVAQSWETDEHTIYGRFDLAFDGNGPPKLLEYNADTPTALLEAAVIQWFWFKDFSTVYYSLDQFNSIHERLIEAWAAVKPNVTGTMYFTSVPDHLEDYTTVSYLRDTAMQAGLTTDYIQIGDIGWNADRQAFLDLQEQPIAHIFKLYPWEWLIHEEFGQHLLRNTTQWLEAPWKMILSNKAILPVLHQLFPDSPYLLRAEYEPFSESYVRKPRLAREGANICIIHDGIAVTQTTGDYADCPCIYQAYQPLPQWGGNCPVIGSWMINGYACGIGIREDTNLITGNLSRFVPHVFRK